MLFASQTKYTLLKNFQVLSANDISKEIQEVVLQVDHSKSVVDSVLSFVENIVHNFSTITDMLVVSASLLFLP